MLSKTMAILLGIIEQQPVNAYELNKWLSVMHVRDWYNIASSTVYATLKAAEKKDYITGTIEKSGNMPDKTIYSMTDKGRAQFLETIKNFLADFDYDITPFHIGLFFVKAIDRKEAAALLENRVVLLKKYEEGINRQLKQIVQSEVPKLVVLNLKQNLYIVQAQQKGAAEILLEMKATKGA